MKLDRVSTRVSSHGPKKGTSRKKNKREKEKHGDQGPRKGFNPLLGGRNPGEKEGGNLAGGSGARRLSYRGKKKISEEQNKKKGGGGKKRKKHVYR